MTKGIPVNQSIKCFGEPKVPTPEKGAHYDQHDYRRGVQFWDVHVPGMSDHSVAPESERQQNSSLSEQAICAT